MVLSRSTLKICESKPERKTEVGRTKMISPEQAKKDLRELESEEKHKTRKDMWRDQQKST
jgi:hypothetical protein